MLLIHKVRRAYIYYELVAMLPLITHPMRIVLLELDFRTNTSAQRETNRAVLLKDLK